MSVLVVLFLWLMGVLGVADSPNAAAPVVRLLDDEDVAAILKCTPRFVRKLHESRQLPVVFVGRLPRVEVVEVMRYIARNRRPAVGTGEQ